jgi:hypothetical protein
MAIFYQLYMMKKEELASIRTEVSSLREKKQQIDEVIAWNQNVTQQIERLKSVYLYQSFTDGLETIGTKWDAIMQELKLSMPSYGEIVKLNVAGNQLSGMMLVYDLKDIAAFMEKMKTYPNVEDVYVQIVDKPKEFAKLVPNNPNINMVEFSVFSK